MKKHTIFHRRHLSSAIMALTTAMTLPAAYAGSGWGDSADATGTPIKTPTYYANSPSGLFPAVDCFATKTPPKSGAFNTTTPILSTDLPAVEAVAGSACDSGTALRKFVDPVASIPVAKPDTSTYAGSNYYEIAVVEYTQRMHSDLAKPTTLRGYVQVISDYADASKPANVTANGQSYTQPDGHVIRAVGTPSYLGPIITATTGKPTRIKFYNLLPSGAAGNLHLPVDETITGAGCGPTQTVDANGVVSCPDKYQQNRAEIHLHGGDNPWISDGTPHQWILPAADEIALSAAANSLEKKSMARGVGAKNVPDMPNPGPGAMTYYFPNGQSGRLMFFHDHSLGITRLNVYSGIAAGYVLSDPAGVGENYKDSQDDMAAILPDAVNQIPLIIQDKTFVPKNIAMQDAKWDTAMGQEGDLWYPHVYETNQDPNSFDGTNPVGRWDWGSWFWPVFPSVYDLPTGEITTVNPTTGLHEVSTTPEAYMDTPVVNGVAYPTLTVDPKAYRFRVLNAANDRFLNMGLYLAADKNTTNPTTPTDSAKTIVCDGRPRLDGSTPLPADCTEVKMVSFDANYAPPTDGLYGNGNLYTPDGSSVFPDGVHNPDGSVASNTPITAGIAGTGWGSQVGGLFPQGAPDPATAGPHIVQIGNEGGLLAQPLDIPSTPLNYEYNKRSVTVLNVQERGLYLGPAERADVLVDFSQYAGKTLILYNDAPAPTPASDPRIDYYTGNDDNTGAGGAPTTKPGFGPNTRTIMQIVVAPAANGPGTVKTVDLAKLQTVLPKAYASVQPKPIVPQPEFNNAFPAIATPTAARNNARIYTGSVYLKNYQGVSFTTPDTINYFPAPTCTTVATCVTAIAAQQTSPVAPAGTTVVTGGNGLVSAPAGTPVNAYVQSKAIQELFDPMYGRMNATLGVELPFTSAITQTTIPLGYVDPATEKVADGETQFWKITHNGVDSHPVHFHLVNVQVINRIGWDGTIKQPYGDEFGWKETVKMNPLEDIVVAVRAKKPVLSGNTDAAGKEIPSNAFGLPISSRLMDPSQKAGSALGFTQVNPDTGNPATVTNSVQQYGWEYTWHCHILGHEENDFMRPVIFNANEAPAAAPPQASLTATADTTGVKLAWTDVATTEYAYKVERGITTGTGSNAVTTWTDLTAAITPAQQAIGVAPLANASSFVDTTPPTTAGMTYQYRVTAIGANGNGSTVVSYTVPVPVQPAVVNNSAISSAAIQRTATRAADLTWAYTAPSSTANLSFSIESSSNNGATWTSVATNLGISSRRTTINLGTTTTANGLNALYRVSVVSSVRTRVNGQNVTVVTVIDSSASIRLNDTVAPEAAVLATPTKVSSTRRGTTTTTVTLSWTDTANNNASYDVQRSSNNGTTWTTVASGLAGNVTTTTDTINGVPLANQYQYRIIAINSVGSTNSSPVTLP